MHAGARSAQGCETLEQWLNKLKDMDALCHVVRAFEDPAVFHASGSVDPLRDIEVMNLELAIADLGLVDLRLERIAQEQKRKQDPERAEEAALLLKLRPGGGVPDEMAQE